MAKSPAFQFYPKDFLSDINVQMMTDEERGIYITILCHDWLEDGLSEKQFKLLLKGGSSVVEERFIPHPNREGFFTNTRLLDEREKQAEWREKSSEGGKKSAQTRKSKAISNSYESKGGSKMVEPNVNSSTPSPTASASPIVNTHEVVLNQKGTTLKFNPEGKKKYLDWVYLSETQFDSVKGYYEKNGLTPADFNEAVRELDAWYSNNPKMRQKRTDDAKALKGWPLDRALQRRANLSRLEAKR